LSILSPVSEKLSNYLKAERKRTGLSQKEVAFLLGCTSGAKVSRYERFHREPTLRTALAYEALFHVPVAELFAGMAEETQRDTRRRARRLTRRLANRHVEHALRQKLAALESATRQEEDVRYEPLSPR
jgi:transcriptional regulator with XRE-family HTH domain